MRRGPLLRVRQLKVESVWRLQEFMVPMRDGIHLQTVLIFVLQNLRGRFKSEGVFLMTEQYDPNDPNQANETNDAYDTIDWLVKNVPLNNGRVGIYGVSYAGLTAGLTLLHPHPALKAVSEQASPVDQWMNDDMHRYGALRESYAFEYSVLEEADKSTNTHFDFNTYDTRTTGSYTRGERGLQITVGFQVGLNAQPTPTYN
jgi:predicted acyl esterase